MKILFTGASSFTGYWFVKELVNAGHEVWCTFTSNSMNSYTGLRLERIKQINSICNCIWSCQFGDDKFIQIIKEEKTFDVLCHHGAYVHDYKSLEFDINKAVLNNTLNCNQVLQAFVKNGGQHLILTGSVFEQNEGVGNKPLKAFSPYGLSKSLTAEIFKFWCDYYQLSLAKFVIPNPFGPYEEPRFTSYLMRMWLNNELAEVRTPSYIRDNIHVSLLAQYYRYFINSISDQNNFKQINPCGYIESQGQFTKRFAEEMRSRLNLECNYSLVNQVEFTEPRVRLNTDTVDSVVLYWSESKAWEEIAKFYKQ